MSAEQLAFVAGTNMRVIRRLVSLEVVEPVQDEDLVFPPETVERLRKALRLHHDLQVGWSAVPLVMDLLDRIEQLEEALRAPNTDDEQAR